MIITILRNRVLYKTEQRIQKHAICGIYLNKHMIMLGKYYHYCIYPNVPWPILANFSNFVATSQNGKLYSSKYFYLSRAIFICSRLGDGVVGGVKTPFKFVMAAVLKSVSQTCGSNKIRCGHNGITHFWVPKPRKKFYFSKT